VTGRSSEPKPAGWSTEQPDYSSYSDPHEQRSTDSIIYNFWGIHWARGNKLTRPFVFSSVRCGIDGEVACRTDDVLFAALVNCRRQHVPSAGSRILRDEFAIRELVS
jgi:hypothetical protein